MTDTEVFPLDMTFVLANPDKCVVCRRNVSDRSIDKGQATMIVVDADGNRVDGKNGFHVVAGPECKDRIPA